MKLNIKGTVNFANVGLISSALLLLLSLTKGEDSPIPNERCEKRYEHILAKEAEETRRIKI